MCAPQWVIIWFIYSLAAMRFESRISRLLGRRSYHLSHSSSPFFVTGFFEMGSQELFAGSGLEP
jgi:hypothetical protein